jgi:hypothetical protein
LQSNFYISAAFGLSLYSTATIFYRFTVSQTLVKHAAQLLTSGEYLQPVHRLIAIPHRVNKAFTVHTWVTFRHRPDWADG